MNPPNSQLTIALVSTHPPGKGTLNEYGFYLLKHIRQNPNIKEVILIADDLPNGEFYEFDKDGCPIQVHSV